MEILSGGLCRIISVKGVFSNSLCMIRISGLHPVLVPDDIFDGSFLHGPADDVSIGSTWLLVDVIH
jgi:hypothetical protein